MPLSPDDGTLFDPKWFVLTFGLVSDGGPSCRHLLIDRTRQQLRNCRKAATAEDERSGA